VFSVSSTDIFLCVISGNTGSFFKSELYFRQIHFVKIFTKFKEMQMRLKWLRIWLCCAALLLALPVSTLFAQTSGSGTTITLIDFSDYHSHAVPFYSEGQQNQAGIARTIAYLKSQKQSVQNLMIISGGDTMNLGSPTWSDEYKCIEWPWFNGLVDVMALGNHEFDYGADTFKQCQSTAKYPIISGNFVDPATNQPLLTANGKPYFVKEIGGVKLGFFALAGSDFDKLIKKEQRPSGGNFVDGIPVAKQIVSDLRDKEKVNAVIYIGHSYREEDTALAQQVSGIDLVLGSHSHYKSELTKLPNTQTWFISPFQYLTYLSRVELSFDGGKLAGVKGQLIKMDQTKPEDPDIKTQVQKLQKDLEAKKPEKFKVLGNATVELSDANVSSDESVLGNWALDTVRKAAGTHAFFSTASSFRAAIPPGPITVENFFTAIPYKNAIVTSDMSGQQLTDLINLSLSKRGSDSFSQLSGVRFSVQNNKAANIQVLADPANDKAGYIALDPAKTYKVGSTDFQALVAPGYKDIFAKAANVTNTKRDIGTLLTDSIQSAGTVTAKLDGRMGGAVSAVGGAPASGFGYSPADTANPWLLVSLISILSVSGLGLGLASRQRRRQRR
jgi:5'-nucleotidase